MSDLIVAYESGQLATAIVLARRALAHHPHNGAAQLYLGMALRDLSRYEEAESLLTPLLADEEPGRRAAVRLQLGILEDRRGNLTAAEHHFQGCIVLAPNDAGPRVLLGAVYARAGRLHDAEATHREAVTCSEGPIDEAWLNLGLVLRGLERFAEADFCLRKALELDPKDSLARDVLAGIRTSLERESD